MPEWLQTIRSRPGLNLTVSLLIGLAIGLSVIVWWEREDAASSIVAINTGNGLTVVINHDRHHVLFVGGTDGSAFANAIDDAVNPLTGPFDLILIDPASSADVEERARSLDPHELMVLPDVDNEFDAQPITVMLSDRYVITVTAAGDDSWQAMLATPAGSILIHPGIDQVTEGFPIAIQTGGSPPTGAQDDQMTIIAQTDQAVETSGIAIIPPGEKATLTVDGPRFRIELPDS